jgi:hypothetical protein
MLRRLRSLRWGRPSGCLAVALLSAGAVFGAILPDQFAGSDKSDVKAVKAPDPALFEEYGFDDGEQATYGPTTVTAWRFRDSTGALAGFQYLRPAETKAYESKLDKNAARSPNGLMVEHGNYVVQFAGKAPTDEQVAALYGGLAKLEESPLPVIATYLPAEGLIPNSERYILGPVSLEKFDPKIGPSLAAFHLSAEAQYGKYRTKAGDMSLAIFNYPTPGIARERAEAFQKLPNTLAKRTGPIVAVVTDPPDADAAERLLAKVNYTASITWSERTPTHVAHGVAKMILDIAALAGIIIGFCIVSGVAFAGIRILSRRLGPKGQEDPMITLHLEGK